MLTVPYTQKARVNASSGIRSGSKLWRIDWLFVCLPLNCHTPNLCSASMVSHYQSSFQRALSFSVGNCKRPHHPGATRQLVPMAGVEPAPSAPNDGRRSACWATSAYRNVFSVFYFFWWPVSKHPGSFSGTPSMILDYLRYYYIIYIIYYIYLR